jgi:hypothetical protein
MEEQPDYGLNLLFSSKGMISREMSSNLTVFNVYPVALKKSGYTFGKKMTGMTKTDQLSIKFPVRAKNSAFFRMRLLLYLIFEKFPIIIVF